METLLTLSSTSFLKLNYLRVTQANHPVYDQEFHDGVNIIRGQNGSGKSTIADFIFFILGGEFDNWKDAAGSCNEVLAEVQTPRGRLSLRREIDGNQEPVLIYFGPISEAIESSAEGWKSFPIRRQTNQESFSQVMFRSMYIPEAKSEGAANVTMHQLLRLCYSDQRTPAQRLFRLEQFDTHSIRGAVGDLICGVNELELYEIELELREQEKELAETQAELHVLQKTLRIDESLATPSRIGTEVQKLKDETIALHDEIDRVEELVEPAEVNAYLEERKIAQAKLVDERNLITTLESSEKNLQFELTEIEEFLGFLGESIEKVHFAEATFETIGSIEFTHCPACGAELDVSKSESHCILCKSPIDVDEAKSRYNMIRLDLEIQTRESRQLIKQKQSERREMLKQLSKLRRDHEKKLSAFNLRFAGSNGPRDAFLATRINRLGHIEAQIEVLLKSLDLAKQIVELEEAKNAKEKRIGSLREKENNLRRLSEIRRPLALSQVSDLVSSILRSDLKRQDEFGDAGSVEIDFRRDSMSVDGQFNFAESSNVFLKNATVFGLFLAAAKDEKFFHPRFVLIDNIEDKGMEEARSHLFQEILVDRVAELEVPFQVIFTTSMMNPILESDKYTIGPQYTNLNRTLNLKD